MPKTIQTPAYIAAMERAADNPASAIFWVGLDVGVRSTAVCVLDNEGCLVHEITMKSDPTEIGRYLRKNFVSNISMIGLESGGMARHLTAGLRKQEFPVVILDALQIHKVLTVRRNKTDTNDARGIAEVTRTGRQYLTEVFLKSNFAYEIRAQLGIRDRLVKQRVANELSVRGQLRLYGRIIEGTGLKPETFRDQALAQMNLAATHDEVNLKPRLLPILDLCVYLQKEADRIEAELTKLAGTIDVCARFMKIPGVGPITAISFLSAIEDVNRFRNVEDVAAYLGLTPRVHQSGDTLVRGPISRQGNTLTRTHLVSAATVMMSSTKTFSSLKDWGLRLSKKVGFNKAKVALARKLAVTMASMWKDGTFFRFKADEVPAHRALMQKAQAKQAARSHERIEAPA